MTSTRVALRLSFAFLFYVAQGTKITVTNNCPSTIWPGTLTGDQKPQLSTTGFELQTGASTSIDVPFAWSGRFWARTGCSSVSGRFTCATGDCGSGQVACNGAGPNGGQVAKGAKITFTNKCQYTVWPGTLTGDQKPQLSTTGFELATGASNSVSAPSPWSGRFWGRTGCSNNAGKFTCATADCGSGQVPCNGAGAVPPATLIELTIAPNGGQDFYDVSNVDGFNLPMSIAPQGGNGDCKPSSCPANINAACPAELQKKASDGDVIACMSACLTFNESRYCCTEDHNKPETCPPTMYSQFFEQQCPDAYSYAYDDKNSTFACSGGPGYTIIFCP